MKNFTALYLIISIVVLVGLRLVSSVGDVPAANDVSAWEDFKAGYNKTYASEAEEQYRMKIFLENKYRIESHNTKSSAYFVQGINPLSDLTAAEINKSRNGFKASNWQHEMNEEILKSILTSFGPNKLDWRSRGRISRVKDQGACGSCWAFSVTGALESVLAARNKSALLSEQNLVDCSGMYGNQGCSGGWMDAAFRYVRDNGIMLSSDYPYTATDGTCKFRKDKSALQVRGSVSLPRGNEALLRLALTMGPITVAIDAGLSSFHSYKSGVYNDESCRNSVDALNHAVLLVGYGTDETYGDYWLVKNSWGRKWGDQGYIKMARNSGNLCGVASYAVLPIP